MAQQWLMEGEEAERWKAGGGLEEADTEEVEEADEDEEDPSPLSPEAALKYSIGGGLAAMAVIFPKSFLFHVSFSRQELLRVY